MASFSDVMVALSATLPSRVLSALGLGFVSLQAYKPIVDSLVSYIANLFGSLPVAVAQIFALSGVTQGVSLILSAYTARSAMFAIQSLGKV